MSKFFDPFEINLFNITPKKRDYNHPVTKKEKKILSRFEKEYFESQFLHGYHGYEYNGCYRNAARNIIKYFNLPSDAKVLDVGCVKGFLLYDLLQISPNLCISGVDVSKYAIKHAIPEVSDKLIRVAGGDDLPFNDNEFDMVLCINVLINIETNQMRKTLREIERVSKTHKFIQTPSYYTEREKSNLVNWVPIVNSLFHVNRWKEIFSEEGYSGHYYWFIFSGLEKGY